jgi:hypothetical protein
MAVDEERLLQVGISTGCIAAAHGGAHTSDAAGAVSKLEMLRQPQNAAIASLQRAATLRDRDECALAENV